MPTYQYKCSDCGHEFEEFQSINDDPIEVCPSCKSKTRRVISGGAGLIFKGSGFYITDYRSDSYTKAAKSESGSATESNSGGKDSASNKSGASSTPKNTGSNATTPSTSSSASTKSKDT